MERAAKTEKAPRGSGTAAKTAVCALALAAVLLTVHAVLCLYHGMYRGIGSRFWLHKGSFSLLADDLDKRFAAEKSNNPELGYMTLRSCFGGEFRLVFTQNDGSEYERCEPAAAGAAAAWQDIDDLFCENNKKYMGENAGEVTLGLSRCVANGSQTGFYAVSKTGLYAVIETDDFLAPKGFLPHGSGGTEGFFDAFCPGWYQGVSGDPVRSDFDLWYLLMLGCVEGAICAFAMCFTDIFAAVKGARSRLWLLAAPFSVCGIFVWAALHAFNRGVRFVLPVLFVLQLLLFAKFFGRLLGKLGFAGRARSVAASSGCLCTAVCAFAYPVVLYPMWLLMHLGKSPAFVISAAVLVALAVFAAVTVNRRALKGGIEPVDVNS